MVGTSSLRSRRVAVSTRGLKELYRQTKVARAKKEAARLRKLEAAEAAAQTQTPASPPATAVPNGCNLDAPVPPLRQDSDQQRRL